MCLDTAHVSLLHFQQQLPGCQPGSTRRQNLRLFQPVTGGNTHLTIPGHLCHKPLDVAVCCFTLLGKHKLQHTIGFLCGRFSVGAVAIKDQNNFFPRIATVLLKTSLQLIPAFVKRPAVSLRFSPCADDIVAINNQQRFHALREASTRYIMTPAATDAFRLSMLPSRGRETR